MAGLESREYGRGKSLSWPRDTLYPQKLTLTSPTSGRYSSLADSGHGVFFTNNGPCPDIESIVVENV
jgi:hypothetical protein